ncbi:S8 family serine peptidase [uncultured Alistipes sp.]|uniref:S8 family peptidase n=1 Tax=uncultured Alistipes sp. TaxID=538949 RepID=UPI0025851C34|nr:S8 family serine peptidase [uncultured Alistipes sp.]
MKRTKTLWSLLLLSLALVLGSCAKDATEQATGAGPEAEIASKLIFSPKNAIKGELLVYFGEEAVPSVEKSVMQVTRAGGVATRSGIVDFDAVLGNIGVKALQRLFPVDERNEERTRAAGLHRWYIVDFDDNVDLDQAARSMARISEVSKVQFNKQLMHVRDGKVTPLIETAATPQTRAAVGFNDPHLGKQWHYINTGDKSIYSKIKAGADVNCDEAWQYCTGDPRVVVAVVDGAVQWDHPDLEANMWINTREQNGTEGRDDDSNGYADDIHGYNFVDNQKLTKADDHGTHVAGTVAAVNNNATGVCGVAGGSGKNDGVKIMSCQIFRGEEGGSAAITAKAIKYAADNGAAIIQCSFGYEAGDVTSDSAYASGASAEKQAIDYFTSTQNCAAVNGGIAIFAAGNDLAGISGYPGAYRDYISVTSMSCDYTPAYYTNYGPGCNVAAPGGDAYQSYLENRTEAAQVLSTIPGGRYGYMQGTSMACPHVSGVAALGLSYALQLGKTFSQSEFRTLLLTSVNDINQYCTGTKQYITDQGSMATLDLSKHKKGMGTGYIDAYQVLMNVRGITCIPIPAGSQYTLNMQPYLGDGNLNMTIRGIDISTGDMERLGMTSKPTLFANQIILKCTKPGSAIVRISLMAGNGNDSGMNGMQITKEFALIVREIHSQNGGWL